jgi:acyl-CoA hydrolase
MTELVLPQHANSVGTAFGGSVMGWVDICGAISAQRHSGKVVVTASVDALDFHAPIRVGDLVCLEGRVNAAFRSSIEVGVRVEREDRSTRERMLCVEAFLTFVAVDEDGCPTTVPPVLTTSDEERDREAGAKKRRQARLEHRKKTRGA